MATRKKGPRRPKGSRSATLEVDIRAVGHGGDGVAELPNGATVLVHGGLPGDRALVQLRGKRRGVERAQLLRVLGENPARVSPACPHVDRCGGCPWMPWSLAEQRERKRSWVAEAVAAVSDTPLDVTLFAADDADAAQQAGGLGYRRTARLAYHRSGQGIALGYHGAGSRQVVAIERCAVLVPELQAAIDVLRQRVLPTLQGHGEIALDLLRAGVTAELRTDTEQSAETYAALRDAVGEALAAATLSIGAVRERFGDAEPVGDAFDGSPLHLSDHGFLQANAAVNRALVQQVAALSEPADKRVLELYAGHGNFTVALAPEASAVTAIEVDESAVQAGRHNLQERGLDRARFVAGDVATSAGGGDSGPKLPTRRPPKPPKVDVVVLDPPRTGAREVMPAVIARRPERVVYVSCDMPTLSRDLRTLADAGYRADFARGFDMFPHTAHVEAVVRMRAPGRA